MLKCIPDNVKAELARATEQAALNIRDTEVVADACARMDQLREEIRQKHGNLDVAVELVRKARDDA